MQFEIMSYGTVSEDGGVNYGHQSGSTVSEVTTNAWVRHPGKMWTSEGANRGRRIDRVKEKLVRRLTKSIMDAAVPHFVEKASLSILSLTEKGAFPLNERLQVMRSFPGSPALSTAPSGETITLPLASLFSSSHVKGPLMRPPATSPCMYEAIWSMWRRAFEWLGWSYEFLRCLSNSPRGKPLRKSDDNVGYRDVRL